MNVYKAYDTFYGPTYIAARTMQSAPAKWKRDRRQRLKADWSRAGAVDYSILPSEPAKIEVVDGDFLS